MSHSLTVLVETREPAQLPCVTVAGNGYCLLVESPCDAGFQAIALTGRQADLLADAGFNYEESVDGLSIDDVAAHGYEGCRTLNGAEVYVVSQQNGDLEVLSHAPAWTAHPGERRYVANVNGGDSAVIS